MTTSVLLVTKRAGNARVMKEALAPHGWVVIGVSELAQLGPALADLSEPCVGLVDVSGFGPTVWEICETLHSRGVRFVVLSAADRVPAGRQALTCGAATVLQKPVAKSALLQLLETLANRNKLHGHSP